MQPHTLLKTQFRVLTRENESGIFFHLTSHEMEAKPGESVDVRLTRKTVPYHG